MKKLNSLQLIKNYSLVVLFCSLILISCDDDEETTPSTSTTSTTVTSGTTTSSSNTTTATTSTTSITTTSSNIDTNKSVIVIGAGAAGLSAAKKLNEAGYTVIVLEAQEKIGGRLRTDRSLGVAFDEGASWIHGPTGNPITELASKSGINTFLTDDENIEFYDADGTEYNETVLGTTYSEYQSALQNIQVSGSQTRSFEDMFTEKYSLKTSNRLWKFMLSAYLEFSTGADISELSSLDFADDEAYPGTDVIITNGYDKVANYLATGLNIKLNQRVSSIDYSNSEIVVSAGANSYKANYVIVTVPLGVLKKNIITFTPTLPTDKTAAIAGLKMSAVNKFLLVWDTPFWNTNLQYIAYTPETKGKFNYFLNLKKFTPTNALMTFAFGNYGKQTETMTDSEVTAEIMTHLKAIYGNTIPQPKSMLRTKWSTNINTYGSYSFATNGVRSTEFDVLANSVNNKLFFAGEHTSKTYRGTVHGAYLTGQREADKIIALK